ncbi:hypothetical protein Hypma_016621 [Hypsizygus marmoreus]|uniref:Uncharacterized protein n=1 Tax=Hypsizygus marmoreus TaxID=39966 RepID=A0A369J062_HYPMA|nr:hypothetical protein Hypma_016621 [Hypsizygus marmoreus]
MGIFLFYAYDFPFPTFTAYALRTAYVGIIFFLDSIVFALLTASLAIGSGPYSSVYCGRQPPNETFTPPTGFQAAPMAVALIALVIIAFYTLHRVRLPYQEANRPRSIMTFSALCPVSLTNNRQIVNSLMFIIRLPSSGEGNLQSDFSGLPNPGIAAYIAMVISCLATFVGTAPHQAEEGHAAGPSMSTNSYYKPSFKNPGLSGTAEKQRPLQTTYDHWTEIPV